MTFDPKGTAPGLSPQAPKEEKVNLKCQKCPSMVAVIMKIGEDHGGGPVSPHRLYRCVQCNFTWGLNVGGAFNI